MRIVTRDDIQGIGDAASLMQFLDEKLGLPIPEGLGLGEIVADFSPYSLGLSGDIARKIMSCQEISGASGEPSSIFLIRFRSKEDCSEVLRLVSGAPRLRGRNLADFGFICMGENYQPFAFAYFSDSVGGDWQNAELTVFSWTEAKTVVHTSAEHVLPDVFFPAPSPGPDDPPVTPGVNERPDDPPDPEDLAVVSYSRESLLAKLKVVSYSRESLLAKLKKGGLPLGQQWTILSGNIVTRLNRAFVIEEFKREQLIAEDPASAQLMRPLVRVPKKKKWGPQRAYLIWIPNGRHKQWPWSVTTDEAAAERIFAETYPAISNHLNRYRDKLKNRSAFHRGEFYWELSVDDQSPDNRPRIIYPDGSSMRACYVEGDALRFLGTFSIPTTDLSLLAILNSKLFHWWAQSECRAPGETLLKFKKSDIEVFPVAERTEEQKAALAGYVQLILDEPNSSEVPALEEEIDALVYALYRLTEAERALIEEHR